MDNLKDFDVSKFYIYKGPNFYLNKKALVFNIYLDPDGPEVSYYKETVYKEFPQLSNRRPSTVIDLFASTIIQAIKMDFDFYLKEYSLREDDEEFTVAVEYFDEHIAEGCVHLVSKWFKAMNEEKPFDFRTKWKGIPEEIDEDYFFDHEKIKLFTAATERKIPIFFIDDYIQICQLGYGKKQLTIDNFSFNTDSMTDYSVFSNLDAVKYLKDTGFLARKKTNCFTEDEAVETALKLGFPIDMIPDSDEFEFMESNIFSEAEIRISFNNYMKQSAEGEGVVLRKSEGWKNFMITTVAGKMIAAVESVAPFVIGNGRDSIKTLIEAENDKEYNPDIWYNGTIEINEDTEDFLADQNLSLGTIPDKGKKITVIDSTEMNDGSKTFNVNNKMHPANKQLIEFYAKLFNLKCLLFYVEAQDISRPWNDDNFQINNIHYGGEGDPIYYTPQTGDRVDLEGAIIDSHFIRPESSRIPIISGNHITQKMADSIYKKLKLLNQDIYLGSLTADGVSFNGNFFIKNENHDKNVKIILRNPQTCFAIFNHDKYDITDFGFYHEGADLVILDNANETEESMKNMLTTKDYLMEINDHQIELSRNGEKISSISFYNEEDKERLIMTAIEPLLKELINKYE